MGRNHLYIPPRLEGAEANEDSKENTNCIPAQASPQAATCTVRKTKKRN